ncbi:hypothetical protein [Corallococcus sicarius]|uniref:PAS domain-containing protein n=1 Tax=Corallococcus sicarius TaxID=2316726 RepID=A0A3A8P199_9BACT|nr:hypothetical protein [Corallococcus sicarius]RKH47135.1 hypothetical protein D7X12_03665 [Corallococcus sicarius]
MPESKAGWGGPLQGLVTAIQAGWQTLREERLFEALVSRVRSAFRTGLVPYLMALLFLSVALITGRMVVMAFIQYHNELRQELSATLKGKHQAGREDVHFGVVAALLRDVNSPHDSTATLCPPQHVGCTRVDQFLKLFNELAKEVPEVKEAPEESTVVAQPKLQRIDVAPEPETEERAAELAEELHKSLSASLLRRADREWQQRTALDLQLARHPQDRLPLKLCPAKHRGSTQPDPHHDDDFGPMLCEQEAWSQKLTQLFIPSLENLSAGAPLQEVRVKRRLQRAYWLSRLMDDALLPFIPETCPAASTEAYAFVQAYFVSPDNLIRIWQCQKDSKVSPELFERTRQWSAASYFQALLKSEASEFNSAAYFDYGGLGLIRTRCQSITQPFSPEGHGQDHLLGIICADYTVPLTSFSEDLARSRLLEVQQVSATLSQEGRFTSGSVSHRPLQGPQAGPSPEVSSHATAALVSALNAKLVEKEGSGARGRDLLIKALGQQVSRLDLDQETSAFFIPLKVEAQQIQGLLTTPRIQYPDAQIPFLITLFCLVSSMALVVTGQARARLEGEAATITQLLRNLEVGIIIVNEHERVEAANDRAEDVLGLLLPKLGKLRLGRGLQTRALMDEAGVQVDYLEIIDTHIVRVDEHGRPWNKAEPYQDVIPAQRRDHDSSTYYARLRMGLYANQWVCISASPITLKRQCLPQQAATQPRTFGIVSQVLEQSLRDTLERCWQQARGNASATERAS